MPSKKRTELVKLRLTPAERSQLDAAARDEKNISDFVRKQVFGRQSETVLTIGRIHGQMLQIGRALVNADDSVSVTQALAYLVAIEAQLSELLNRQTS